MDSLKSILNNDLNTAEALALFIKLVDDTNIEAYEKLSTILSFDDALGFGISSYIKTYLYIVDGDTKNPTKVIEDLYQERLNARINKDYAKSDELRNQIQNMGFIVIDTKDDSIVAIDPLKFDLVAVPF